MVGPTAANAINFSSTKIQMISRVQHLPLLKQESFLRAKYDVEMLSVNEIAALTFSSRSTVVKYLERLEIPIRRYDRTNHLKFGSRWRADRIGPSGQEHATIKKAKALRSEGLSYEKIATVLNTMKVRTRSGRSIWYAKTVREILLREAIVPVSQAGN